MRDRWERIEGPESQRFRISGPYHAAADIALAALAAERHPPARAVINAVVISRAKRVGAHRPLGMVGHVGSVRRKKRLILLVHPRGDVGPPEKSLNIGGAIVDADLEFDVTLARMQADAVHAFHASHRFVLCKPDGDGAVRVLLDFGVHGQKVAGRWCCGQLNSIPPLIHGPARPTSAGLMTGLQ